MLLTGMASSEVNTEAQRKNKAGCCLENLLSLVAHGLVGLGEC